MAGIGFRLQALLQQGGYGGLVKAYAFTAIIATGPWLLAVIGVSLVTAGARLLIDHDQVQLFISLIVYAYAASLVLTGFLQMGATRYIADRLYVSDLEALAPCYHLLLPVTLLVTGLLGALFLHSQHLPIGAVLGGTVLFQAVSVSWTGMWFLSAGKDYLAIVWSFALGYAASTIGALVLAEPFGLTGLLWGFACGQVVLAGLLGIRVLVEFPSHDHVSTRVLGHLLRLPSLMVVGVFYNAGIWLDNVIYWWSEEGVVVTAGIRQCPRYDTCVFLAYLTIVPAMAQFMLRVEVAFYRQYAAFYGSLVQGASEREIGRRLRAMAEALRLSAGRLVQLQGVVSALCLAFAPQIIAALGLPPDHVYLLRICTIGAFVHVLLQIALLVILYFDWRGSAAVVALTFCLLQGGGALVTAGGMVDPRFHGIGYVLACLVSLLLALVFIEHRLRHLVFETFVRQPM